MATVDTFGWVIDTGVTGITTDAQLLSYLQGLSGGTGETGVVDEVNMTFDSGTSYPMVETSQTVQSSAGDGINIWTGNTPGGSLLSITDLCLFQNVSVTVNGVTSTTNVNVYILSDGTAVVGMNNNLKTSLGIDEASDVVSFDFTGATDSSTFENVGHGFGGGGGYVGTITICLASGTLIETDAGLVAIEDLSSGDIVQTSSNDLQPIRWIGSQKIAATALAANPKLRPVRIMAGALGNNLPERDLVVSRQHRMMVSSKIAERMFGSTDVLIPAIKLTDLPGIFVDKSLEEVEYFHVLFDQHEVIFAEGAPTESLFTGPEALKAVAPESRAEILELFPELNDMDYTPDPAAFIPSLKQQKALVTRHVKNGKPLQLGPAA